MSETASVSLSVLEVERFTGRGRLFGFAQVELVLDGVQIILQGVRIVRRPDGLAAVEPPCYRHSDGDLVPAVVLPEELDDALARAVLERVAAPGAVMVPV